jgi:hypothetical protein
LISSSTSSAISPCLYTCGGHLSFTTTTSSLSLSLVYSYLAHAEIEELKKQSSDVLAEAYLQSVLARAYALFLTSEQPDVDTVFQVKHSDIILLFFFPHVVSADER